MELNEIIAAAARKIHVNQRELAKRIGLHPTALSHIMRKRRALPAEAAIELSELTGMNAKQVWLAAQRYWRARDDSNVRPLPSEKAENEKV